MKRLTQAKLDKLEQEAAKAVSVASNEISDVFGVVCPDNGLLYNIEYQSGEWIKTAKAPNLFIPAKMEIALRAKTRFIIIIGGRGCVHEDTLIDTPSGKVAIKNFKGGEVFSYDGSKVVTSIAGAPMQFDEQEMYEVITECGKAITCTDEHLFCDGANWVMTQQLSVGSRVLVSELPTASFFHHQTNSGSGLSESLLGAQHSTRKLLGYLASYLLCLHQCDLQPQLAKDTFLASAPSLADEQLHNFRALFHADDSAFAYKHIPSLVLSRLSSLSALPAMAERNCAYQESYNAYKSFELLSEFYLQPQQSQRCINQTQKALQLLKLSPVHGIARHQVEILEIVLGKLERAFVDNPFVHPHVETSTTISKVASIRNIGRHKYYDMNVIGTNCYFANGFLNHNSGKSNNEASIDLVLARNAQFKIMELREFQSSMKDSVHSLLSLEIKRLQMDGFDIQNDSIFHKSGGAFSFQGLSRNPESVKSAAGFDRFVVEEAQFLSEKSLNVLTPTARNAAKPGLPTKFGGEKEFIDSDDLKNVQIVFIGNPQSAADPFSLRFITPYKQYLDKDGIYTDELHTIIKMNYEDNPWFEDSGLDGERQFAFNNFSRALYDHIWLGEFNDHVPDAIIMAEWFDACIDAHIKLGWKPKGAKIVTHDPADSGDAKGVCGRHGSVITHLINILDGDVNSACDIATEAALAIDADKFVYDATGIGLSLRRQINDAFSAKKIDIEEFFGSGSVDDPKGIAENYIEQSTRQVTNDEFFANIRAQRYFKLAQRVYRTWRAVTQNEYTDPSEMISFSSECSGLTQLRTELCRIPRKRGTGNGYQIASKQEMKKLGMKSPNLADCVMMSETDYNPVPVLDYSNINIPSMGW